MVDTRSATDPSATVDKIAEAKKKRQLEAPREAPPQPFFFELSRLMVVAINAKSSQLVYKAQSKPNGPWEADWTPIDSKQTYGVMTAGIIGDGRVAVVAQPSSPTALFYIDEVANAPTQQWNAPVNLGKPAGVDAFLNLAMAFDTDARLEVFGTDTKAGIWWKYQNPDRIVQKTVTVTPPGTTTPITVTVDETAPPLTPWSDWMRLPGTLGAIRALRMADGRIILFGINAQNQLYRNEQRVARALKPDDWSGWVRMDDNFSRIIVAMMPALDALGAVNLFGLNADAQILQARQSPPCTSTWTGWSTPGFIREGVQAFTAGIDGDSHLVLVATDKTKLHNVNRQIDVQAQQWSGWTPFANSDYPTQLDLDYNADGRLTLFSHWLLPARQFGGLWCVSQMAFNSTQWEVGWTTLAPGDIKQYVVVRDLTPPASAFR